MTEVQQRAAERLHAFFRPRSIALIGATDNSRWSVYTFENLKRFAFPGPIYLIHPYREIVHGERALKSLQDLPGPVDLAFIMVPTPHVLTVVQQAVEMGIKQCVVLTSGFSEVGAEGVQLESDLVALARAHNLILLGPNGNGFINVTDQIAPYGLPIVPPLTKGPVGVVLQSGALASAVLAFAQAHAIGLSLLVSMGNESMLSVTDVVDYLLDDEATHAIALFLESIRHPDELRLVADKARARQKPLVVLKIGRSEMSARTALAHTGALVGNDAVNDAAFRQLGILRVHTLEDLLTTAGLAGYLGALPGRRMGVVTPSGGACDIISDLAQDEGIVLPEFASQTIARLSEVLPPFSTAHNPLDVTGYVVVDGMLQQRALEVVVDDPGIDFVLYLASIEGSRELSPSMLPVVMEQYGHLATTIRTARVPVALVSNTCLDLSTASRSVVDHTGLHVSAGLAHGIHGLGKLLWWSELMCKPLSGREDELPAAIDVQYTGAGNWSEMQARTLLQKAEIAVVPGILAKTAEEALLAARTLGFPVVLKVQSRDIPHKSDVGGVLLNLHSEEDTRAGYNAMLEQVQANCPQATIEGVLVSPMRPAGIELLVGILRDPLWGPVLTIGLGGIWTEALRDTAVRLLPVQRSEVEAMLGELRGAALLYGGRGHQPVDMCALSEMIYRISKVALALGPRLNALEINPLLISQGHIEVLDALVNWQL